VVLTLRSTAGPPVFREWTSVDGLLVHARVSGSVIAGQPTIVLVHGLGMSSSYMLPLLRELAPRTRVLAVDLPGYGRSQSPDPRHGLAELADDLAHWMQSHAMASAVVVGNSLGAQVIAQLGVRHPDRLLGAVLIGATRDPAAGGKLTHTLRLLLDMVRERPSLILVGGRDYLRAGPVHMVRVFSEALDSREESQLVRLRTPTLIVRGSLDPVSTQAWNEQIAALVPDSELLVIEGAPHAVNFSRPKPLAAAILRFASAIHR
jgi:2-hydroxy-6-oxonona-2,4-dienedioate hydrolase